MALNFYLGIGRFSPAVVLQRFGRRGEEGNLEITSVIQEEAGQMKGEWAVPYVCSALCESDGVGILVHYARELFPGTVPEVVWVTEAPEAYVRRLPRKLRKALAACSGVDLRWADVIECSREKPELGLIADLVFDLEELAWREYGAGRFPKKTFVRPS